LISGIIDDLLGLSHELGSPAHDWAILGEGNTSARIDDERFLVKASGSNLATLSTEQLVDVRFAPLLGAIADVRAGRPGLSDAQTRELLASACTMPVKEDHMQWSPAKPARAGEIGVPFGAQRIPEPAGKVPSVETLFHGLLLQLPGVAFIGHTHVTSINGLLCSDKGWELMCQGGRIFPDEIVVCGIAPCCVPYSDPGLPLAIAIDDAVQKYLDKYDTNPKTMYLQSHGFIALGGSAREVVAITQMADKAARITLGAIQAGGPRFLPQSVVDRIANRPDEHHRQRQLGLTTSTGQ